MPTQQNPLETAQGLANIVSQYLRDKPSQGNFGSLSYETRYNPGVGYTIEIIGKGIEGKVILQSSATELYPKPLVNAIHSWQNIRVSILDMNDKSIRQQGSSFDQQYPSFVYEWDSEGALRFLGVHLSSDTFVSYEREQQDWKRNSRGAQEHTAQLPMSLNGLQELLDKPIPWKIDYIARANEILQSSGLIQFAQAIWKYC